MGHVVLIRITIASIAPQDTILEESPRLIAQVMKYIDAERLKESVQVEFDKGNLSKCPQGTLSEFGRGYHVAMSWVLNTINSLQQEQPSEDLEEAVEKQIDEALYKWSYDDEDGIEQYVHDAFIAGAEWQKEQMMREAVEGEVHHCMSAHYVVTNENQLAEALKRFNDSDKVRIIIVKED